MRFTTLLPKFSQLLHHIVCSILLPLRISQVYQLVPSVSKFICSFFCGYLPFTHSFIRSCSFAHLTAHFSTAAFLCCCTSCVCARAPVRPHFWEAHTISLRRGAKNFVLTQQNFISYCFDSFIFIFHTLSLRCDCDAIMLLWLLLFGNKKNSCVGELPKVMLLLLLSEGIAKGHTVRECPPMHDDRQECCTTRDKCNTSVRGFLLHVHFCASALETLSACTRGSWRKHFWSILPALYLFWITFF